MLLADRRASALQSLGRIRRVVVTQMTFAYLLSSIIYYLADIHYLA